MIRSGFAGVLGYLVIGVTGGVNWPGGYGDAVALHGQETGGAMGVLDLFRLDGKRAVVTGASRGLGRSMALALADAGADVVITGRTQESLDATADEIRAFGWQAWTVKADMGVPTECAAAYERILRDFSCQKNFLAARWLRRACTRVSSPIPS